MLNPHSDLPHTGPASPGYLISLTAGGLLQVGPSVAVVLRKAPAPTFLPKYTSKPVGASHRKSRDPHSI